MSLYFSKIHTFWMTHLHFNVKDLGSKLGAGNGVLTTVILWFYCKYPM
jgi:uncharacterized membrane protein